MVRKRWMKQAPPKIRDPDNKNNARETGTQPSCKARYQRTPKVAWLRPWQAQGALRLGRSRKHKHAGTQPREQRPQGKDNCLCVMCITACTTKRKTAYNLPETEDVRSLTHNRKAWGARAISKTHGNAPQSLHTSVKLQHTYAQQRSWAGFIALEQGSGWALCFSRAPQGGTVCCRRRSRRHSNLCSS